MIPHQSEKRSEYITTQSNLIRNIIAKISNLIQTNQNYSDPFRNLFPKYSDLVRIRLNPNQVFNPSTDLSKPNFQSESIWMDPRSERFGSKISFGSIRARIDSESFGFIPRIESVQIGLTFDRLSSNSKQNIFWIGSEWFAMVWKQLPELFRVQNYFTGLKLGTVFL